VLCIFGVLDARGLKIEADAATSGDAFRRRKNKRLSRTPMKEIRTAFRDLSRTDQKMESFQPGRSSTEP
jgi:hypothetical protein